MPNVATGPDIHPDALVAIGHILAKYDLSDRFGLYDIHSHFPMQDGEVIHETNDPVGRVIFRRPVHEKSLPSTARATAWRIDENGTATADTWCCDE
jgi:hypothetical protein